jgi:anti-sigma B factor antagonist
MGDDDALTISIERQGGTAVLRLAGELDLATAPVAQRAGQDVLTGPVNHVVIDLGGLTYADVKGAAAIVEIVRCAEDAGHRTTVEDPSPMVRWLLEQLGG